VTVERVDDDQPRALPVAPEVVPAGARMLPLVARPEPAPDPSPYRWDHIRGRLVDEEGDQEDPTPEEPEPVTDPYDEWSPDLDDEDPADDHDQAEKVTSAVPADTPREVVTQVVALTPSELRRRASKLNRELVASTGRQVTIDRLREEYGLSRREAAELRREVVTTGLFTGEAGS
jgi:hypothetical protein